jgi:AraC family transcriptional regulator of adaptative response/methylated-DNA-[protein]-cysteine methyltransferase
MSSDYERIETAIRFIEDNAAEQPSLEEISGHVGLSPFHFQRLFRRWAGISPKRFLQFVTVEHAKELLAGASSVMDTAYEVGLSGPARLHDHFVALEAVTPGEYKSGGAGLEIVYGVHDSPFGEVFLATTDRGICGLRFVDGDLEQAVGWLGNLWPGAHLDEDKVGTRTVARQVFEDSDSAEPIPVLVKGTNFQVAVWKALLRIPAGQLVAYEDVARSIGRPSASRAVGSAVGANRISYLIPCHRVIRSSGALGGYAWGSPRKRAIIGWEVSRSLAHADWQPEAVGQA